MFCSNCGQELAPEAKFCSNCGAPVNTGASVEAEPRNETAAERRERERREDFEKAWGGSASSTPTASTPQEPSAPQEPAAPESSQDDADDANSDSNYEGGFSDRKATWELERDRMRSQTDDEWSMPDLGPPPAPRRRRTWLWVLLGMIAFIVIACCVFGWWITATESGTEWFEGIATQAAEEMQRATDEAATPQP